MDLKTWIERISVTNMAYEFCILIRDSGAKPKNTVICLPGMHETLVCAESAHLKKKKIRSQEISYPRAISLSLECGQHMSGSSEV